MCVCVCVCVCVTYFFFLGHPQARAFITPCGTNGIYEAVYHGSLWWEFRCSMTSLVMLLE